MPTPPTVSPECLSDPALLSDKALAGFQEAGYLICRGAADAPTRRRMLEATREGLERRIEPLELEADVHYPGAPSSRAAAGGETIRRLRGAHARGAVFLEWVATISGRMRQLFGGPVVMPLAHHNCIMTKHPHFSSDTGWHQDIRYWSFTRPELVSAWLALGPEFRENGSLRLIPGSHRMTFEREQFDEALFFRPDVPQNAPLLESAIDVELEAGDLLIFHARTLHAARRNQTNRTKYSLVFSFRPLDNPPLPGTRSAAMPELLLNGG